MLRLYNSLGKRFEKFQPVNKNVVNIFTCGPSVYQRSHIGNFRTFLFEDVLARYMGYLGYKVCRGMNFTDIEDKALVEAEKQQKTLQHITDKNIMVFIHEMKKLRMKIPDYLPRASESIKEIVKIIELLLESGHAYRYKRNIYFDPLKFPEFGKIYGLDMSKWPRKRRRFHKDTYQGLRWNLGDFVIWHGYKEGDKYYWDTNIGKGRPSWNIQDPSMIMKHFKETLSIYCGGVDNLYRHHDYTCAILESVRPYPMSRLWLHCNHLFVNGKKMSKRRGNILYTDDLQKIGFDAKEIRFFLTYGRYRERMNYSDRIINKNVEKLKSFRNLLKKIEKKATSKRRHEKRLQNELKSVFIESMNNDLDVKGAFDGLYRFISEINIEKMNPSIASGIVRNLREIDRVLQVIY